MPKRPLSITIISWLFIAMGGIGSLIVLLEKAGWLHGDRPPLRALEFWPILISRLLSLVAGVLMLYGINWGRWLLVVWIGFHIVISAMHSTFQLALHVLIFSVILYFLFRPPATAYLRGT